MWILRWEEAFDEHERLDRNIRAFFGFTGTVLMAEEKPEAILAAAKKLSDNQPWQVEK